MLQKLVENIYGKKSYVTYTHRGEVIETFYLLKIGDNHWYSRVYNDIGAIYTFTAIDEIKVGTRVDVELNVCNVEHSAFKIHNEYNGSYKNDVVELIRTLEIFGIESSITVQQITDDTITLCSKNSILKSITLDLKKFINLVIDTKDENLVPYVGLTFNYSIIFIDKPVECFAIEIL